MSDHTAETSTRTAVGLDEPPENAWLRRRHDQVLDLYGDAIGHPITDVITPALLLDLSSAQHNIDQMAAAMAMMPADLRPHIKVHKSPHLAHRQVAAGAIGLSVATVWEAAAMAAAGLDDLFIVNTVTHPAKNEVVAALARDRTVLIAVDSPEHVEHLDDAARRAGSTVGVLIEVDTGMDRAGVDTAAAALALAQHTTSLEHVTLEGVSGYEGHCSLEPDSAKRAGKQGSAMNHLTGVADHLRRHDFAVPIVSAGGTATWSLTAADPRITEIQAGSYALMDNFHGAMIEGFAYALTVATTVISTPPGRIIIDAGNKSVGVGGGPTLVAPPLQAVRFDEEHGIFEAHGPDPRLGDTLQLRPGYAPATVNLYDAYYVTDGRQVVDVWPILARGPHHAGLTSR